MEKHDNDECHRSFILKQKSGLSALDMAAVYHYRLSLSFIIIVYHYRLSLSFIIIVYHYRLSLSFIII